MRRSSAPATWSSMAIGFCAILVTKVFLAWPIDCKLKQIICMNSKVCEGVVCVKRVAETVDDLLIHCQWRGSYLGLG